MANVRRTPAPHNGPRSQERPLFCRDDEDPVEYARLVAKWHDIHEQMLRGEHASR